MKICRDCAHFVSQSIMMDQGMDDLYRCHAPLNLNGTDIVLGGPLWKHSNCRIARSYDEACGPDGAWFVPRPSTAKAPGAARQATAEDLDL
jgi:hypothetical protein